MFYFLPLVFMSFSSLSAVVVSENLIPHFLEKSPDILSYQDRLESAQKLKGSLRRSFLPDVKLTYGREQFTTGPYHSVNQSYGGIEAEVNIFNSGRDVLENKVREKRSRVAGINMEIAKARLTSEAQIALANLAYLKELLGIIENALSLNSQNISGARKRINAGLTTKTDLIDFNQQKITLLQESESIKFEQGVVQRLLAVLLGIDPKEEIIIKHENSHPEHGEELQPIISSQNSRLVQKADLLSEIARLEKRTAQKWWAPKLDVYSYALRFTQKEREFDDPGERNDFTFGFRFTLPIFDGGESIRESAAKAAEARAMERELKQKKLEIEKQTLDAQKKLELAHTLIHGAEESISLMSEYRLAVSKEYAKGVKNSPDVLQATQRWIEAKIKFAEVKKNYQIAKAEALYLKELSGK